MLGYDLCGRKKMRASPTAIHTEAVSRTSGDSFDGAEIDKKLWGNLPQPMVEEVLARLSFKHLIQCRVLSKAFNWGAGPNRNKKSSRGFEETIMSVLKKWPGKWPTYCPLNVFKQGLLGYNNATQAWEKIFDLKMFPFLSENIDSDSQSLSSCSGALICFASANFSTTAAGEFDSHDRLDNEIYIVNVVTKKWKRLPPRPELMQRPNIMHLKSINSNDYEIVLLTQLEHSEGVFVESTMVLQTYNSSTNSWQIKKSRAELPKLRTGLSNYVYLKGVFYIAIGTSATDDPSVPPVPPVLLVLPEKGPWITRHLPLPVSVRKVVKFHILLCGPEGLTLVARQSDYGKHDDDAYYSNVIIRNDKFLMFKVALPSGQIKEEEPCPCEKHIGVSIDQVLAFGDSIYFGGRDAPKTPMHILNVRNQEWSYRPLPWEMPKPDVLNSIHSSHIRPKFNWTHSALQPGLNAFAEV